MSTLSVVKKQRGIVRALVLCLTKKLKDSEGKADQTSTLDLAQGLALELGSLYAKFQIQHFQIVDFIDE